MPHENHHRRLVTIAEACEYLQISRTSMWRRIREGAIPAHRIGPRSLRVDLDEVDRAIGLVES